MILRISACVGLLLLSVLPVRAADNAYTIKTVDRTPAPDELHESIRNLLGERTVHLLDDKGDLLAELWFRKEVPAEASEAQIKNGLTYSEIAETSLFGAVRFPKEAKDYRKQKIPAGVYTLRLAIQPVSDDHVGTAPHREFLLLSPAAEDGKPDRMEPKALRKLSGKTTGDHPGVLLLSPGKKAAEPKLEKKEGGHWMLLYPLELKIGDKKTVLPINLTLIGASPVA